MEKRNFTRVSFSGEAEINYNNSLLTGNVENLSLQGFYIKTNQKLPFNKPLEVRLFQSQDSSLEMLASVVHSEEDGMGMKIGDLDVNSFVRLRDVVSCKSNSHAMMMGETLKMLRCLH